MHILIVETITSFVRSAITRSGATPPPPGPLTSGTTEAVDREAEARRIVAAAKQTRARAPRWLIALSIVVGATCCIALAIAWYGNRGVKPEHAAPTASSSNTGFAAGLGVGAALGAIATAAILMRRR
jgi:hypothetical protein